MLMPVAASKYAAHRGLRIFGTWRLYGEAYVNAIYIANSRSCFRISPHWRKRIDQESDPGSRSSRENVRKCLTTTCTRLGNCGCLQKTSLGCVRCGRVSSCRGTVIEMNDLLGPAIQLAANRCGSLSSGSQSQILQKSCRSRCLSGANRVRNVCLLGAPLTLATD